MHQRIESHYLTDAELRESYWIVTHWKKIERGLFVSLVVFNCVLFLFLFASAVKTYVIDAASTKALVASLAGSFSSEQNASVPVPLEISALSILGGDSGHSDLLAPIHNPNSAWRATFDVVFSAAGSDLKTVHVFVYPNETAYAMAPGPTAADGVSARIENLSWRQLTKSDFDRIGERKKIAVFDTAFSSSKGKSIVTFAVSNASAHGFWNVPVSAILMSGSSIVAAQRIALDQLDAGQKKHVQMVWYQDLPQPSAFIIAPDIDLFDQSVYRTQKPPLQRLR